MRDVAVLLFPLAAGLWYFGGGADVLLMAEMCPWGAGKCWVRASFVFGCAQINAAIRLGAEYGRHVIVGSTSLLTPSDFIDHVWSWGCVLCRSSDVGLSGSFCASLSACLFSLSSVFGSGCECVEAVRAVA